MPVSEVRKFLDCAVRALDDGGQRYLLHSRIGEQTSLDAHCLEFPVERAEHCFLDVVMRASTAN